MNYDHYGDVKFSDDYQLFLFDSIGLRGNIKKAVIYSKLQGLNDVYNLTLGTIKINKDGQRHIDSEEVSNNGDRDKILATVALSAFSFMDKYPDRKIYVRGADPVRTRLYQIAINNAYTELSERVVILGDLSEHIGQYDLGHFERGINYKGFLIIKK